MNAPIDQHRQLANGPPHCCGIPSEFPGRESKLSLPMEDCFNSNC